jgi:hypothetical protein
MHKVVVERPRWNPGPGKYGRRANLPDELLPKFQGIKRPHVKRKGLTDLLGPLKRWLHSQVGRPWNEVYSEACAVIKPDSVIRAHIKTHLLEFVERHTFMHEDQVCVLDTWRGGGIRPVTANRFGRSAFYVHPETGLLCEIPTHPRRYGRYEERKRALASVCRWLDDGRLLLQLGGFWFECDTQPWADELEGSPYDAALKLRLGKSHAHEAYGKAVYCVRKRQLSRKGLRRYRLQNARGGAPIDFVNFMGADFLRRVRGANGNPFRRSLRFGICARVEASAEDSPFEFAHHFESGQQPDRQFAEAVLRMGWSIAVRFRTLAENQLQVRSAGETPHTVRGRETGAQAQPEGGLVKTRK